MFRIDWKKEQLLAQFQRSKDVKVLLLTSRSMSSGLSIAAADRVIIVEPNENPIVDEAVSWAREHSSWGVCYYRRYFAGGHYKNDAL